MSTIDRIYRCSLGLLTDLYELTMAYGYWKLGRTDQEAVFHLFFRKHPFRGGYTIACGLAYVIDFLECFRFDQDDTDYLAGLKGNNGKPLFETAFLEYLRSLKLTCDIDAVPEGTVVFPQEPLVRVQGPILQCQIIESALLNMINFASLIATKAARVCSAAQGEPVLEFGLRRAQGIDGALAASRAAYIGGCSATSNVLAGRLFGIRVGGTHAHSWVMSFDDELEAFDGYARALPNNCIFLVDTYDTLDGVRHAIEVGRRLRERGHDLTGIRLDSGDLAYLSIEARRMLDEAGFARTFIVGSNDLDEHIIASLKNQGARIAVWGVGTCLATAHDQPALGGVYKLGAVRRPGGPWQHKVKLSEQAAKVTTPGRLGVRRYRSGESFTADMIYDLDQGVPDQAVIVDPVDATRRKLLPCDIEHEDLLLPVFRGGGRVYDLPAIDDSRNRAARQLSGFHPGVKRFVNPHEYPTGLEQGLFEYKTGLVLAARGVRG